jgi:organic hydroperoxide reductase OsmC/OhrA
MRFDIQSSSAAAKQELSTCSISVLAGQGANAITATYRPLGTIVAAQGTRLIDLKGFSQPLQTPNQQGIKGRARPQTLFLRAAASCSSGRVNLLSQPMQVRTSRAKTALPATRWSQRLAAYLRLQ